MFAFDQKLRFHLRVRLTSSALNLTVKYQCVKLGLLREEKSVMNKERLLELADVIERAPVESFDMDDWLRLNVNAPCGTAACIAGHTCLHFVAGYDNRFEVAKARGVSIGVLFSSIEIAARDVLELTDEEADRLFFASSWPSEWEEIYENEHKTRNKVASAYIREFVRTDGFGRVPRELV